jgi:hypothetical protein
VGLNEAPAPQYDLMTDLLPTCSRCSRTCCGVRPS